MIQTKQLAREIDGVNTEVVIQRFADCTLLLITQLGKVGNLIRARIPDTAQLAPAPPPNPDEPNITPLPPPPAAIELAPLLGTASTEHIRTLHSLYASQAATLVWASSETAGLLEIDRKDVIVGIALRQDPGTHIGHGLTEYERRVFHGAMGVVKEVLLQE